MFEHYRSRIEAIGRRPFLRAGIQALTSRWEQNNEPPPAPPQIEPDASQTPWKREAQEEDYFNASDDEEDVAEQPKPKRAKDLWFGSNKRSPIVAKPYISKHYTRSSPDARAKDPNGRRSRVVVVSNSSPSSGNETKSTPGEEEKPSLGLDYDDGSDSDTSSNGNQSPRTTHAPPLSDNKSSPSTTTTEVTEELEEDLMDVTMKMRAKRQREEEDDADFAGLFGSLSKGKSGDGKKKAQTQGQSEDTKPSPEIITSNALETSVDKESGAAAAQSSPTITEKDKEVPEGGVSTGKRLKLNFGFGRKSK